MKSLKLFLLLLSYSVVNGQDTKARGFRHETDRCYDTSRYYNVAFITSINNNLIETIDIHIFIRKIHSKSKEWTGFTVCEKTDIFLAHYSIYDICVTREGYSTSYLRVVTAPNLLNSNFTIQVNLEEKKALNSIGVIGDNKLSKKAYYNSKAIASRY